MAPTPNSSAHRALFAIGTGLWVLAFGVLAVLDALGLEMSGDWLWVCAAGAGLGAVGTGYAHFSWRAR
jgi:hypothetical protein